MASKRLTFWNSAVTLAVVTASVSGLGAAIGSFINYRESQIKLAFERDRMRCMTIFEYLRDDTINPDLSIEQRTKLANVLAESAKKCAGKNEND